MRAISAPFLWTLYSYLCSIFKSGCVSFSSQFLGNPYYIKHISTLWYKLQNFSQFVIIMWLYFCFVCNVVKLFLLVNLFFLIQLEIFTQFIKQNSSTVFFHYLCGFFSSFVLFSFRSLTFVIYSGLPYEKKILSFFFLFSCRYLSAPPL